MHHHGPEQCLAHRSSFMCLCRMPTRDPRDHGYNTCSNPSYADLSAFYHSRVVTKPGDPGSRSSGWEMVPARTQAERRRGWVTRGKSAAAIKCRFPRVTMQ